VTKTGEQAQVRETKQYLLESKQGLGTGVTKTGEQAQVRETKQYLLESKQGLGAAAVNHGEKNHQRRECESMRTGAASWLARDGETELRPDLMRKTDRGARRRDARPTAQGKRISGRGDRTRTGHQSRVARRENSGCVKATRGTTSHLCVPNQ
jgi:hypothetical protein